MWQRGSQKVSRKSVQYPVFMIVKYGIILDICHSSNFLATAHDLDLDGYISLGHITSDKETGTGHKQKLISDFMALCLKYDPARHFHFG